jgi:hypothetical protein
MAVDPPGEYHEQQVKRLKRWEHCRAVYRLTNHRASSSSRLAYSPIASFQFLDTTADDAIWSARRDTETGYGIAVFDLDPGIPDGKTSITVRYYHALGAERAPTSNYELFETLVLAKDRRDTSLMGPTRR